MHVVILAAGKSKRFQDAGYSTPKPFLNIEWRGRTEAMILHVLRSLPVDFSAKRSSKITIAVPDESYVFPTPYDYIKLVSVGETRGPAHTALIVLENSHMFYPTLILDSDVINHTNDLWQLCQMICSGVLVSKSNNTNNSYVEKLGHFIHVKEKFMISDYAVRGAYFIPTLEMSQFVKLLDQIVADKEEPFISHVFDLMDGYKYAIETTYQPVDWGTPEAVAASGATIKEEVNVRDSSDQRSRGFAKGD